MNVQGAQKQTKTTPNQNNPQQNRFGRNVTTVIYLKRHCRKDYATGNLSPEGKQALLESLLAEHAATEADQFDIVECCTSPLKRGQQAKEVLAQFLLAIGMPTTVETKEELRGLMDRYTGVTDEALNHMLVARGLLGEAVTGKADAFEPESEIEEREANRILLVEYFDQTFPEGDLKGIDVANELDSLVRQFAIESRGCPSGNKVKKIAIGHSGIYEYLTKLVYLQNHPDIRSEDVSLEMIGGLIAYLGSIRITIATDVNGTFSGLLEYKHLSLRYDLTGI